MDEHLSDSVRCAYFGWQQGSNMARVYTHNVETDKKILELNGLLDKEKDETGKFKNIICPRCGTNNPYGNDVCKKCNLGLDVKSIMKMEKNARILGINFLELLKDPNILTKIANTLAEEYENK